MTKNLLKILVILTMFAIPKNINESSFPKLKKLNYQESIEVKEKELINYKHKIININDKMSSLERKKDFFLMRLQEKNESDSIKNDYIKKLSETQKELKKYTHQKDSIYKLTKK